MRVFVTVFSTMRPSNPDSGVLESSLSKLVWWMGVNRETSMDNLA